MRDHRSLKAWQEANRIANAALDLSRDHWKPHLRDVLSQLTRAAISAQVNISEGYGLGTPRQFLRHLRIAHGSSLEARDLIDLLASRGEIPRAIADATLLSCRRCQAMLIGLLKHYQRKVE